MKIEKYLNESVSSINWIDINDRLPNHAHDVLVLHGDGKMEVLYFDKSRNSWYPGGLGVGWTAYWAELPKPPSGLKRLVGFGG